jgi:hypothetical protein
MSWSAQTTDGFDGEPVAGGVQLQFTYAGGAEGYGPQNGVQSPGIRVDGDVKFTSGAAGNALGLGCEGPDRTPTYWFFIHDDRTWTFDIYPQTPDGQVLRLASGDSASIGPTTAVNRLAVACTQDGTGTNFELAANGVPLANLFVQEAAPSWYPIVASCSPSGPDTAVFTNVTESSVD